MDSAIEQISPLTPSEVAALLVCPSSASVSVPAVQFRHVSGGFSRSSLRARPHCLYWRPADARHPPPWRVAMIGDRLRRDLDAPALRLFCASVGTVHFVSSSPSPVAALRLTCGTSGVCSRALEPLVAAWKVRVSSGDLDAPLPDSVATDLFARQVAMWCLSQTARVAMAQLETAFPLLLALDVSARRQFVAAALTRHAGGVALLFGDALVRRRAAVGVRALLSPPAFAAVSRAAAATAAFVFGCQLRHAEALDALRAVAETCAARGALPSADGIRRAVSLLLAHAAGSFALPLRHAVRPPLLRHLPLLAERRHAALAQRAAALSRGTRGDRRPPLRALLDALALAEALAEAPSAPREKAGEVDGGVLFDSVAPSAPEAAVWRLARDTLRFAPAPPPDSCGGAEGCEGTAAASLLSALLLTGPRLSFARPLLRLTETTEPSLNLNVGKGNTAGNDSSDDSVFTTTRKRRRRRKDSP